MDAPSTKAYEAFHVLPILDNLPGHQRVESLCCWQGFLLVGLHDGTIVQCAPQRTGSTWQVVKAHRSLNRKAVVQMAAVRQAARPLLLVLTEAGINLHTLPDMQLKYQPMGSRGASLFAWSEEGQLLAVAVRRKVLLYQLRGSELLEAGERAAPDAVLAMQWVGPGLLLLGLRRQYVLMNTGTGATTDVTTPGYAPHPLAQLCPGGQEVLLARDSTTYFYAAAEGRYSRRRHLTWSDPLQALTAVGHYAVALTAGGALEVRSLRRVAEGHVVQRVPLAEAPGHVAPAVAEDGAVFVAARLAAGAAGGATATTTTAAPSSTGGGGGPTAASAGGAAAVAAGGGSSICRLVPVPLEVQAHTLAELGEYGEALALAALVEDEKEEEEEGTQVKQAAEGSGEGAAEGEAAATAAVAEAGGGGGGGGRGVSGVGGGRRALLEERLRLAYGHYLFQAGEYDEGMAQLALCKSTTALVLLRLFPSLVPDKFKHLLPREAAGQPLPVVSEPSGEAYVTAVSQLLPYILSHRTRAMAALAAEEGGADHASEQQQQQQQAARGAGEDAEAAANGTSSSTTPAHATPDTHANGSAASSATHAALPSTPNGGYKAPTAAADAEASRTPAPATASPAPTPAPAPPPPGQLLCVLDTAIVRMLTVLPDSGALLRFVQLANRVDLREGEQALSECGMYAELAALYKYNGCHEEGLELLRRLSQEPDSLPRKPRGAAADLPGLPGVWAAVRYLVSLTAQHAPVITRHAGWMLAADPEAGLSALLHMSPPLDPSLALSILRRHSAHYCGLYLETALQIGVALPQDYHNELLLIYLRDILAKEPPSPSRARSAQRGAQLRQLLLTRRPDPHQPQLLFPDDLAAALHPHMAAQQQQRAGTGGGAGGGSHHLLQHHRRFASAPASSVGTPPGGMSRAGSQASLRGGGDGGAGKPQHGEEATAQGPGGEAGSEVSSTDEEEEEVGGLEVEEEEAGGAGAGGAPGGPSGRAGSLTSSRPGTPSEGPQKRAAAGSAVAGRTQQKAAAPAAAPSPSSSAAAGKSGAVQPPPRRRRPRRSSAGNLGAVGKPPPAPSSAAPAPTSTSTAEPTAATSAAAPTSEPDTAALADDKDAVFAASAAAAAGPSLYQRLRDLVYTSPYIDPGYVLDKLPPGELLEIRALMLERLGSHREALRLYVHALRDLTAAEAYCDRVYDAAVAAAAGTAKGGGGAARPPLPPHGGGGGLVPGGLLGHDPAHPGDIYLELVEALYDGPESCPSAAVVAAAGGHGAVAAAAAAAGAAAREESGLGGGYLGGGVWEDADGGGGGGGARLDAATWQALSRVLSRKRERLDPLQVLALLPDGVAVADVLPWVEGALRYTLEARRNLAVIRQLRRSENLTALEEAVKVRQHRVLVTSERACSLCHKRIGGAVFVSYPGGLLAHYLCHKRHTGGAGGEASGAGGFGAVGEASGSAGVVELQHGAMRGMLGSDSGGAELSAWA